LKTSTIISFLFLVAGWGKQLIYFIVVDHVNVRDLVGNTTHSKDVSFFFCKALDGTFLVAETKTLCSCPTDQQKGSGGTRAIKNNQKRMRSAYTTTVVSRTQC
jgi:hypothetical protein